MNSNYLKNVKLIDNIARKGITFAGFVIIASVIAILVFITREALPLFYPPEIASGQIEQTKDQQSNPIIACGTGDYLELGYLLDESGAFHFFSINDSKNPSPAPLKLERKGHTLSQITPQGINEFSVIWSDGSTSSIELGFFLEFDSSSKRHVRPKIIEKANVPSNHSKDDKVKSMTRISEDELTTSCTIFKNGIVQITQLILVDSFLGDPSIETSTFQLETQDFNTNWVSSTLNLEGDTLFLANENNEMFEWKINEAEANLVDRFQIPQSDGKITDLNFVFGGSSICVGLSTGKILVFSSLNLENSGKSKRVKIKEMVQKSTGIKKIISSKRNKSIYTLTKDGSIHMDHITSTRHLGQINEDSKITSFGLSPRGNGLFLINDTGMKSFYKLDIPHPETNWKTLFHRVWYENHQKPEWIWQSSSGSDDFEPKFSMIPLILGSLKGTIYAMMFAAPLAILGAIYLSNFTSSPIRNVVKPTIEILAALPSVVIGFLAALWFAPIVDGNIIGFLLLFFLVPLFLLLTIALLPALARLSLFRKRGHYFEFLLLIPIIILAAKTSFVLGPMIELNFFSGSFTNWIFSNLDLNYDQRNCFIIAFALGFTVIPIIFSISEDSISRVPQNLSAASLALGASRWQTLWRVILPSASPGIFAGLMIGFGRAIGETMIVLMATGNTPIIDANIFTGMRTLSANIAVEIPEAPVDGTLYRVLFLSAVLLLILTSILNTAAELISQSLRKKYGKFH